MTMTAERVADAYVELADDIIRSTARELGVSPAEIVGPSRQWSIVTARAAVAHRLWSETDLRLWQIGLVLGGRDHSTVHHLIRRHELREEIT